MRVVGLLLVSALMVIPVAAAQQISRSFAVTFAVAVAIGVAVTLTGTATSYYVDVPSGATIVLFAIALFVLFTALAAPLAKKRARTAAEDAKGCTLEVPGGPTATDDVSVAG